MCCSLYFGYKSNAANCLYTPAQTKNSLAWIGFPYSSAPTVNSTRNIYLKLFSNSVVSNVNVRVWVWPPLVSGQFSGPEPNSTLYTFSDSNWHTEGDHIYNVITFGHTFTATEVANNVCFLARLETSGSSTCSYTVSNTQASVDPLSAVYNRPW
jgi:hypothetical protein